MAHAINVVPVGVKEAALDSPTFRATYVHFVENVEALERWLESYTKAITKLLTETNGLEVVFNNFFNQSAVPLNISEAVLDHDYTLLALERYGEGAREFWTNTLRVLKKMESNIVEPIRIFMQRDLRVFKDVRRQVEQSQKQLDGLQSRFSGQARTKEASSLREDAFLLHESRKAYLKASMDFSEMAPQLRIAFDKLLVKVFSDQWGDMKTSSQRRLGAALLNRDIERARGWSRDLETSEEDFRSELMFARQQLEQRTLVGIAPSRELEDYSAAFASFHGGLSVKELPNTGPEKQGWLNLRSTSGKPSRTVWTRKWFFVKHGLFGWSVPRHGAVQESEAIGVLLCSVKPANTDERRFCFEIKTKDRTILVQAETRPELVEWLGTFEFAKLKALEKPMDSGAVATSQRYAFAVIPPVAPEFAIEGADTANPQNIEDINSGPLDRTGTLPIPGSDIAASLASRSSFDVATMRRGNTNDRDPDSTRERIIQKLDLHRRPAGGPQLGGITGSATSATAGAGGIASLISASHNVMPIGPGVVPQLDTPGFVPLKPQISDLSSTSLAPVTLVNPPTPTSLSTTAVVINGEREFGSIDTIINAAVPNSMLANTWGSQDWGFLNVLDGSKPVTASTTTGPSLTPQVVVKEAISSVAEVSQEELSSGLLMDNNDGRPSSQSSPHLQADSLDVSTSGMDISEYPKNYPVQLKTQNAQVRLLFPGIIHRKENLLLVFQASWNIGSKRNFPGRVYVTSKSMFLYSNHVGLIQTSTLNLASITEITSATGRDCDFLYLHLSGSTTPNDIQRITLRIFLGSPRVLERRLGYLIKVSKDSSVIDLRSSIAALMRIEQEERTNADQSPSRPRTDPTPSIHGDYSVSPDTGSWSESHGFRTNVLLEQGRNRSAKARHEEKEVTKFKLPRQRVIFEPPGMGRPIVDREYDISPKALFHVLFGDKSVVWQLLYHERQARRIKQGSWSQLTPESHLRRGFEYEVDYFDALGRTRHATVIDYQMIDVRNDHLCYVVTDRKSAWHLPFQQGFQLLSKIVITHVAKSKCRLAIFTAVDWTRGSSFAKGLISRQALKDLRLDAEDLADVITDQVRRLGAHSRTRKAVQIFGQVGQQTQQSELAPSNLPPVTRSRRSTKRRTMLALALESTGSLLESIGTETLQVFLNSLQWAWATIKAQYLLLLILAFLMITNMIASSKATAKWWTDRRALNFVTSLESQRIPVMDRVIFAGDINILTSVETTLDHQERASDDQW